MSIKTLSVTQSVPFLATIPQEAVEFKQVKLATAQTILAIATDDQQIDACDVISQLKGIVRDVEATRKELTQPFLDAQRELKARADAFTIEISTEIKRIEGINSTYQAEKLRIAKEKEEAEKKRIRDVFEAEQKLIREAAEAQRKLDEAEAARLKAIEDEKLRLKAQEEENARQLEAAKNDEKLKAQLLENQRIQAELDEAKRIQDEKNAEANRKQLEEDMLAREIEAEEAREDVSKALEVHQAPINTKVAGASVKQDYEIEIKSLDDLYKAYPQCVELKARLNSIKDLIRVGILDIPGVVLTPKVSVNVRAGASGYRQ